MERQWMCAVKGLALLLVVLTGCGNSTDSENYGAEVGHRAWPFVLEDTTGQHVSLAQFGGRQHVVLQFYTRRG